MGYYWLGCLKKRNVLKVWMHFAKCEEILIEHNFGGRILAHVHALKVICEC